MLLYGSAGPAWTGAVQLGARLHGYWLQGDVRRRGSRARVGLDDLDGLALAVDGVVTVAVDADVGGWGW
ncbi:hypothetical protein ACIBKY_54445 [Nonomuraea sp. NPDC050394]|uniref:hypothetical protein n=1 Tax=Nonomuraea sp. NPDC050394 TaxID=3364363 RepID=UPI0037AA2797